MQAYSFDDVAGLLKVPASRARELIALVWGEPPRLFSFQDLSLLRTAKGLADRRVSKKRIGAALAAIRAELPGDQPLSSVSLRQQGRELVVGAGRGQWNASSGQRVLDLAAPARGATWLRPVPSGNADASFARAVSLEDGSPAEAVEAYAEAVAADPYHADAHLNLGRLLHQRGRLAEAEAHYVAALVARPADSTATFNLAVVLDDLGRIDDAIARYHDTLQLDPGCADAYFNLARLYEKKGEKAAAFRHLKTYRQQTRPVLQVQ